MNLKKNINLYYHFFSFVALIAAFVGGVGFYYYNTVTSTWIVDLIVNLIFLFLIVTGFGKALYLLKDLEEKE